MRNNDLEDKEDKITQFKVKVSLDGSKYVDVDGGRIFTAIPERTERIRTYFTKSYHGQYIRFYPISRGNNYAVRLAWIQGCEEGKQI